MARTKSRRWIGIDGEGIGSAPHRYVLLCAADSKATWTLESSAIKGITTHKALSFLYQFRTLDVKLCGFFVQYDWTMILRDLPASLLHRLFRPSERARTAKQGGGFTWVEWRGWRLHWLNRALSIARGKEHPVTIWDIGSFFQCSFVEALESWDVLTPEQRQKMRDMKGRRSEFSRADMSEITPYCVSECKALAQLATKLEESHGEIGIKPRRWYGPGATAGKILRAAGIQDKRGKPPIAVVDAAGIAFAGGRFEHSTIGEIKGAVSYDLSAAYPASVCGLPCLEHSEWRWLSRREQLDDHEGLTRALVCYQADGLTHPTWGPLHLRTDHHLLWPVGQWSGWAWDREYRAAEQWGGILYHGAWGLFSPCTCTPFSWVEELYEERLRLGKSTRGRALKLALNAVWGRLAQRVGRPPFYSPIWSGIVTSDTRARILEAILCAPKPDTIVAIATDGIITREPIELPQGPYASGLGAWEERGRGDLILVRPGIILADRVDDTRARGQSRHALERARETLRAAIARGDERVSLGDRTLFGGARDSVRRSPSGAWVRAPEYGTWYQRESTLSLSPAPKRNNDWTPPRVGGYESIAYARGTSTRDGDVLAMVRRLAEPGW